MPETELHLEALSPECEKYLVEKGMHSIADHKDDSDPADIYTAEGELVVLGVPRDIPLYYLMRLVNAASFSNTSKVNPRKIIQIQALRFEGSPAQDGKPSQETELIALCEDGTVWTRTSTTNGEWCPVDPIK
jgi:hypothetical protein